MDFLYFVEFDEDGEIKSLHKNKSECENCKEFIVKLIPVDRTEKSLEEATEKAREINDNIKRFCTELEKTTKELRRMKI